jgi:multidrug efflux pump subunit AcrA (membrane-fusion protein)
MDTDKNITGKDKETTAAIELHQREVDDLLGDAPNWLIHTGSYLLYGILTLFLTGAAFIHYPEVVRGTVIIEDIANVEWLTVNSSGQIEALFVKDDSLVRQGDTICIIQNPARLGDVRTFIKILTNVEHYYRTNNTNLIREFSFDLSMGEMTDAYENFTRAVRSCLIYDDHNYYAQRIGFLGRELAILNKEQVKNEHAILKVERELFELQVSHKMEIEKNRQQLELAYAVMVNSILTWESKYLIRSHSEGRIVLGEVRSLTRMVNKGDTIGTIISNNREEFIARMNLDQEQIAVIKIDDPVNIRLAKYPEHTYGSLIGKVSAITYAPYNKQYIVDVIFPDHLRTTARKELQYEIGLRGDAEIITSSRSVLSRIFNPIYTLWRKTKDERSND